MTGPAVSPDLGASVGASGPTELAEVAKAQAAIDAGHDPAAVKAVLTQQIHAYRSSLAKAPTEAPTAAETARGAVEEAEQGLTLGAGNKLIAGTRALLPEALGGTKGFDYSGALADENASRHAFEAAHPVVAPVLQTAASVLPAMAGGAALKGATALGFGAPALTTGGRALQLLGQGATFGATQGALSSDRLPDVGPNALKGGAIGAVAAPLIGGALHLGANLADRTGLTNLASRTASAAGAPDVGEALGAKGAVNAAVAPRVALGEQLGAPDESGQALVNAYRAETAKEAGPLYDAVRNDQTLIDDPRLNEIMQDPAFQKPFQRLVAQRARGGNPVPQKLDVTQTPSGFPSSVNPEDFRRLMGQEAPEPSSSPFASRLAGNTQNLKALESLPSSLTGAVKTDIPDPGALHDLKRIVSNVVDRGQGSSVVLNQQEAQSLAPLLDEVTGILHEKSPAARLADAYYTLRKGGEEALEQGRTFAQKGATAVEGESSPEEAQRLLATPRNRFERAGQTATPDTPIGVLQAAAQPTRAVQFKAGTAAGVRDKAGTLPVESAQDILKLPILDQTPQAAKARAVAIPNATERAQFEAWLTQQHQAASAAPHLGGGTGMAPFSARMAVIKGLRTVLRKPDLIQSPAGQAVVGQYARNPGAMAPAVAAAQRGGDLLTALRLAATNAGAAAVDRSAP